jgi:two-component system nitrogen regulation sensor histidine kinase NtrY
MRVIRPASWSRPLTNAAQRPPETATPELQEPRARFKTWLGGVLVTLALGSALVTFLVLSGSTPIAPVHRVVVGLFIANAVIILALLALVMVQAFLLFRDRWRGLAGASLHVRILLLFSFLAGVPAILLAIIATITLERGLEPWFSDRMRNVIFKSVEVADAYTRSQCTNLGRESRLLADDIARIGPMIETSRDLVEGFLAARATALGLPVVKLVKPSGEVVARARLNVIEDPPNPPQDVFTDARSSGDPICSGDSQTRVFSALLQLQGLVETYLLVARQVESIAVEFPQQSRNAAVEYLAIDARRQGIQIAFVAMYALISLTVLLSAIWFGLSFANALVGPIRRLIGATDEVATGNYAVQVPVRKEEGDLAHLGETFNKMTAELRRQRDGLVAASDVLDRRRRFTETVLAGVSAGVIGLDQDGKITLLNRGAEELLGVDRRSVGKALSDLAPEFAGVVNDARGSRQRTTTAQVALTRSGRERSFNVRVSREGDARQQGLVVTIDDISDLVAAQRTSAWADVARRIAHEIKNPLTPIQLSAERIKRKFGRVIVEDKDILDQCTDTIVRQVEDIRRMVDEFSSFARMPKPQPVSDDLAGMTREVAFLMRVGNPDIVIETAGLDQEARTVFDRRLLSQALTNIIKNATEAIQAVHGVGPGTKGRVDVVLASQEAGWSIDVIDNGKGFPVENRQRLLEPYMTTREGGTGLGLAIVGKILEEHGGRIELLDRADGAPGATVRLWLPTEAAAPAPTPQNQQSDQQTVAK